MNTKKVIFSHALLIGIICQLVEAEMENSYLQKRNHTLSHKAFNTLASYMNNSEVGLIFDLDFLPIPGDQLVKKYW